MAVDEARGIVFVPTGSAAADFYGANRHGDNLFANTPARARRRDRQARVALPGGAPRHLGPRLPGAAEPGDRHARRPAHRRGRADHEARARVAVRPRDRRAALPDRGARGPAQHGRGRAAPPTTQPLPARPAPFARQRLTEDMLTPRTPEAHRGRARGVPHVPQRRASSCRFSVGHETRSSSPATTAAPSGAAPRSTPRRRCSTSTPTRWRGRAASRPTCRAPSGTALYLRDCARATGTIGAARRRRCRRSSASRDRRRDGEVIRIVRKGVGRMPGFPPLTGDDGRALVAYMRTGERPRRRARRGRAPRTEVPLHRLPEVPRPRRLSRDRAAVGHAHRDRPEHRRARLAGAARRVSGARGEGPRRTRAARTTAGRS